MKKLFKWIGKHVRPHFRYHKNKGDDIDFKNDNLKDIVDKVEDKVEGGIKFTFKF